MILLEFSIFPIGKGESVGPYVARSLDIIDKSGVRYQLHAMGTILEGEWDEVMGVVEKCFRRMRRDCARVEVVMKLDYRRGHKGRLSAKVASVEKRLGRKLRGA